MSNVIEVILAGMRANLAQEILEHRQQKGQGVVASCVENITKHRDRVLLKLQNLRAQEGVANADAILSAETEVTAMAQAVIDRVSTTGVVEFMEIT